jgi:hypothetical protein
MCGGAHVASVLGHNATEASRTMFPTRISTAVFLLLATVTVVGTLGHRVLAHGHQAAESPARIAETTPTNGDVQNKNLPHLDRYGDPLPEGAIARLGTVRMRHGHSITGAVFSGDNKSIIASDYYSGIHVWNVAEGKEVRQLLHGTPMRCLDTFTGWTNAGRGAGRPERSAV